MTKGSKIVQGEEKAQCGWKNILKVCSSKKNVLSTQEKEMHLFSQKEAHRRTTTITLVTLVQKNMPKKKVKL